MPTGIYTRTEEHKRKMRENAKINPDYGMRGKHHSEETKRKISLAQKGKHPSEETRRKLSLANRGKIVSQETRRKLSLALRGLHRSEETMRKISEAHKGMYNGGGFKKGHMPWNTGIPRREETRKKIKESLKRIYKKGYEVWNKGVTKYNSPWAKRVSERFLNKNPNQSLEARKKMSEKNKGRKAWNKGKKWSKEIIAKLKIARAKQILPKKDTSIEIKIQNFLKVLGIEYFTHQYIKIEHGYQCDILIPSMNMIIECDGDYWHKYPIGREIDRIRTKELLENSFKVLRLWGHEIREIDIHQFKNIMIKEE